MPGVFAGQSACFSAHVMDWVILLLRARIAGASISSPRLTNPTTEDNGGEDPIKTYFSKKRPTWFVFHSTDELEFIHPKYLGDLRVRTSCASRSVFLTLSHCAACPRHVYHRSNSTTRETLRPQLCGRWRKPDSAKRIRGPQHGEIKNIHTYEVDVAHKAYQSAGRLVPDAVSTSPPAAESFRAGRRRVHCVAVGRLCVPR
ncbi:hypothetical protein DFH06DRAFT_1242789 [Mycena polygramma]|nr:hypothetical protein DFH06DRAFT_1242789 [Mycena polygramma]